MSIFSSLADYGRAIRTASSYQGLNLLAATRSVVRAKTKYGIGPRFHSLFELGKRPESAWADYLIDELLRIELRQINPPAAREVVNDKLAFYEHCSSHGLETIPIRCMIATKAQPAFESCVPIALLDQEFAAAIHPEDKRLFFKLVNGTWGLDAFSATQLDDGRWRYAGITGTTSDLYSFAFRRLARRRGWIVQPLVESCTQLRSVTSTALSTIRLITAQEDSSIVLLFANLRITVGQNATDNFSHGSSGNLVAPIDLKTGVLGPARGSESVDFPVMNQKENHPDTGNAIEGFKIPHWKKATELCIAAHQTLPHLKMLAWDIAITESGPLLVETNTTFDVSGIQVAHQKGIRKHIQGALGHFEQQL